MNFEVPFFPVIKSALHLEWTLHDKGGVGPVPQALLVPSRRSVSPKPTARAFGLPEALRPSAASCGAGGVRAGLLRTGLPGPAV